MPLKKARFPVSGDACRFSRRRWFQGTTAALVAGASGACSRARNSELPLDVVRPAPGRATFYVAADTHFGYPGMVEANRRQIAAMNALVGTPWPGALGGRVQPPAGVIVAGDLTESGTSRQWNEFLEHYGDEGLLHHPVFVCSGNHDRYGFFSQPVLAGIEARHGSLLYGMAWGGLVVLCLDLYPGTEQLGWLRRQLARIGREQPIAIYFHYAIEGPYSDWWDALEKEAFARAIEGYRVAALFHGHAHATRHYQWHGWDVYNVGSPKHRWHSFAVVRVDGTTLTVASRDWEHDRWDWRHQKPL